MDHPDARHLDGDTSQVSRDSPYHQEQPSGCCLYGVWERSIHQGYSCEYHLFASPRCVEEPVRLDAKDSPEITSRDAPDLENIKKLFVKRYIEKARANKAKAASATKAAELRVPKKRANNGGSKGAPKKGRSAKYCKWCKAADGVAPRTSLLSPSIPQRSPGKRWVSVIQSDDLSDRESC